MKSRGLVLLFVLFIFLLSWVCIPKAEAASTAPSLWPKTSGVLCWQLTEGATVVGILKLGVARTVENYYLLNGEIIVNGGTHNIIFGTARVGIDKVLMTVTATGTGETMATGIGRVILAKDSLNGTIEVIGHDYAVYETPFQSDGGIYIDSDTQYSSDVLTYISCP
jgi:hypothetical protein